MHTPTFRNSLAVLLAFIFFANSSMAKEVVEAEKDGVRLVLGTSTIPEIVGEMVPFKLVFEKSPLKAGEHLTIFADTTHLAYVISPTGGFLLRQFDGRVRMNQGTLEAVVVRGDGTSTKLSQRVAIDRPYRIPDTGEASKEFKVRVEGKWLALIHRNRMALTNYVRRLHITVPAGTLLISMTPFASGWSYYRIEADHGLEGATIEMELADKQYEPAK